MGNLLKALSLLLLLATAVLFVLKLDPGKAEHLAAREIVEAAAVLVFGLAFAVLMFLAGSRLGGPTTTADELAEVMESVAATRQACEQLARRLDAVEASIQEIGSGGNGSVRASPPTEPLDHPRSPIPLEASSAPSRWAEEHPDSASPGRGHVAPPDAAAVDERDFAREREKIESLMSIAKWDEALSAAEQLIVEFPERAESRLMLDRVRRERTVFIEGLAERLYEEVKQASARRQWRRAYSAAKRLVEELPNHRRTAKVRPTLDTLAANAEVEERQEREDEIQSMIRSRRLAEAIELSERLIADYPDSPQARSLRELLPKLRERLAAG